MSMKFYQTILQYIFKNDLDSKDGCQSLSPSLKAHATLPWGFYSFFSSLTQGWLETAVSCRIWWR